MKTLLKFLACITILSFSFGCGSDSDDMNNDDNPVCISARENITQTEEFVSSTKSDYNNDLSNPSKCKEYKDALNLLISKINFLNDQGCDGSDYNSRLEEAKTIINIIGC
jgi:hypothetical protein